MGTRAGSHLETFQAELRLPLQGWHRRGDLVRCGFIPSSASDQGRTALHPASSRPPSEGRSWRRPPPGSHDHQIRRHTRHRAVCLAARRRAPPQFSTSLLTETGGVWDSPWQGTVQPEPCRAHLQTVQSCRAPPQKQPHCSPEVGTPSPSRHPSGPVAGGQGLGTGAALNWPWWS